MAVRYDRMIYDFFKKDVVKLDEMFDNAFSWVKEFEADALAAIANDGTLFHSKPKKRSRKKTTEGNDLPPAKRKLSIVPETQQCQRLSVDLVRIDEKSNKRNSKEITDKKNSNEKPVTPAKPPRRNVSRLASITATQKVSRVFADENTDPANLRVTLDKNGQPTIISKKSYGNVPKKVKAYEEKLSAGVLRNNSINLEPVVVVKKEIILESPPSIHPPLHVSSAVLTLSNDKNNKTFSPRVTCSPLNMGQMAKRTSRGTYLLLTQPLFKLPATSLGASRRRSSAMRIKLNSNLRLSMARKSFAKVSHDSFVVVGGEKQNKSGLMEQENIVGVDETKQKEEEEEEDVEPMEMESNESLSSDDSITDEEDVKVQSPNLTYNLRHSRQHENERKSKSPPSENDQQDSVISATPPSPCSLKSLPTPLKTVTRSRAKNNIQTPVLRISRLQSSTSSVKRPSSMLKSRNNLSWGSSNSSIKSQRIRTNVYTPTEKELKLVEALRLKEKRTQEIFKRKNEIIRKRVEEHRRKREERLDRATKNRQEKEKEKLNKRKEHDEEEARRAEAILHKKREQEEQERLHRENEARKVEKEQQQRLRELEAARERELQKKIEEKLRITRAKAESKARAKEELRLKKEEEKKQILQEEKERREEEERLKEEEERLKEEEERLKEAEERREEEERLKEEAETIAKAVASFSSVSVVCEKLNETQIIAEKSVHVLNTTVTLNSSIQDGVSSYDMTPQRNPEVQEELTNPNNYNIDDIKDDDSTDDEEKPKKKIPSWAEGRRLKLDAAIQSRSTVDINLIFPPAKVMPRLDLSEIFKKKKQRFFHRTSSAVWKSPPLKE